MYGPLNACFQASAELCVTARFLAIHITLHEDKLGDGVHPGFTNAERPDAWLLVQGNQASLVHGAV